MATYRKRGDSWRVEVCTNGHRASATFDTKAQAKSWAIDKEAELKNRKNPLTNHTLLDALEKYRDTVSITKKGAKWEVTRINKFINTMSFIKVKLEDLKPAHFAQWRDDQTKKLAPASIIREMNILQSVLDTARREWHWIEENPLVDVRKPTKPAPRDRRISQSEIDAITAKLGYVEDMAISTKRQQVAVAFLFALETAMRAGEIFGLTWDRVVLSDRYVSLLETKNGDKRNVPLSTRAAELLNKLQGINEKYVFDTNSDIASVVFRKARIAAQVEDLHFHDTRHEACTRLARKLPVLDLARMIGHRDLKSLMIYYNATATEIANLLD